MAVHAWWVLVAAIAAVLIVSMVLYFADSLTVWLFHGLGLW
jgi:hypothetical protein